MIPTIGETAGKIWHTLQDQKELSPAKLKKATGADEKILWLALGWLAREGKVTITKERASYKIALK